MLFNTTIGGANFELVLSSKGIPPSTFSVNYISRHGKNDEEKDAIVQLGDFSGSLFIRKIEVTERNDSGENETSTLSNATDSILNSTNSFMDAPGVRCKVKVKNKEIRPRGILGKRSLMKKNVSFSDDSENPMEIIERKHSGDNEISGFSSITVLDTTKSSLPLHRNTDDFKSLSSSATDLKGTEKTKDVRLTVRDEGQESYENSKRT